MRNPRPLLLLHFLIAAVTLASAQNPQTVQEYISTYKEIAIAEMQRTGIPAAIKLAQGIHETGAGTSVLVNKSNNHFGIKCKTNWAGRSVRHDDDARKECFRAYTSAMDSYKDHSDFLKNSTRYASLFSLDPMDFEGWAHGLKKAGYATNPKYPQVLIRLIHEYNLQDYTLIALGRNPAINDGIALNSRDTVAQAMAQNQPAPVFTSGKTNAEEVKPIFSNDQPIKPHYPSGEFRINDTRVIFAKKGTSFLAIANEYQVPLGRIFEFNEMKQMELVTDDQLIYLQRKRKIGVEEFHTVEAGETLHDIAQKSAIRLESLMEYNHLRTGMQPAIGEKLCLKWKATHPPKLLLKESWSLRPGNQN